MLPTKGYFQDIECPYFDNSCGRPYCHFRHRKKQSDLLDENLQENVSQEVPTYKPTPKSELAVSRSHIPISYVPDIIYRTDKPSRNIITPKPTFSSKPTYKPTPISLLTSAVKNSDDSRNDKAINQIKKSMANTQYSPKSENTLQFDYKPTALKDKILNEHLEKHEYKPAGESANDFQYEPTAIDDIGEHNSSDVAYKPTANIPDSSYQPLICREEDSNIDFENLDSEFQMIDEIIMSDESKNMDNTAASNSEKIKEVTVREIAEDKHTKKESSKSHRYNGKSTEKKNDDSKKFHKVKADEIKHNTKKHSKHKSSSGHSSSREEKKKSSQDKKHSSREVSDSKKESKKSKDKDKTREKSKDKVRNKDKEKLSRSEHSEDRKLKTEEKSDKVKEAKHERKDKEKHKSSKSHDKHRSTSSEKGKSKISDKKEDKSIFNLNEFETIDDNILNSEFDLDINSDDDETMRECLRIFNEYKPVEVTAEPTETESTIPSSGDEQADELISTKKRIAHSSIVPSSSAKFQHSKPKALPTPGQIMANRFKIAKSLHANNEEKLIFNEVKRITTKRAAPTPTPSLLEAAKKIKLQKTVSTVTVNRSTLVDEIINANKTRVMTKKIAPVSNVMNFQRAKAQLEELNKKRAAEQLNKTVAQSNKFGKRQAHVPEYSLDDIPDVIDADKSKLPVNVRTRFLTMLADECCKLYLVQKDAYNRALQEEYGCYQKCKVLVTYRNSAMLAVNRVRKEVNEREQNNLGPIGSGESSLKTKEDSQKSLFYKIVSEYILTEEELDIHGYPRESSVPGRAIIRNRKPVSSISLPKNQRKCSRCSKIYLVDVNGKIIYKEECLYHPLKKRTIRGEQIHLCCKSTDDSGCVTSHTHVSEMLEEAELEGFQTTLPPEDEKDPRSIAVYALDCEMCYTTKGLELTRVTIVDRNCKTVYESLVKPLNEIIDYNTRFSGITKQQMDRINTGILQVQANILHLCNSKTILIGHSLESDMKALKIVHDTIVDTSVLFPHKMGLPHKRALRTLASDYLKKIIQNDVSGHDSAEDAITCMELIKWKVKEDNKFKLSK